MPNLQSFIQQIKSYKFNAFFCDAFEFYNLFYGHNTTINVSYVIEKLIKDKMPNASSDLDKTYVVYYFLREKDEILYQGKFIKHSFFTFLDVENPFKSLNQILLKTSEHKSLKLSDLSIEFFVFKKNDMKEKDFDKLFQLIFDERHSFRMAYEEGHLGGFFDTMFNSLFMESYKFFAKYFVVLFFILTLYILNFYKHELLLLGFPYDIVTDLKVMSVIKLFSYIISFPILLFLFIGVGALFAFSSKMSKSSLFKPMKFMAALLSYGAIFGVIFNYNILNTNKSSIDEASPILNYYFEDSLFPRIIENNDSLELVMAISGREMYSFNLEKLLDGIDKKDFSSSHRDDNNISQLSIERLTISVLKHSSYANPKNLDIKLQKYRYLDRNQSASKLRESIGQL